MISFNPLHGPLNTDTITTDEKMDLLQFKLHRKRQARI